MEPADPVAPSSLTAAEPGLAGSAPLAGAESRATVWGWFAVLFVAAFAFLLASHPARNSDLWGRLAAGRDVLRGAFPPGALAGLDVHRTWLSNLALYGVHQAGGDASAVLVKWLLVAGLGLVLFDLSRARGGWWVPVTCTALALLAIGTRLLLQPVTASYLFLGLSLWLLRPRPHGGDRPIFPPP